MSKGKSAFIPVNPWLIQIPETAFNEKNRLIRGENDEKFDCFMQNKANSKTEDSPQDALRQKQNTEDSKIMAKDIPNVFYNCRGSSTNRPFYAKQSQFPKSPNECKLIYNKGLQK